MKLFKENKQSELIEATQGGTCVIIDIKSDNYKGAELMHVKFIDADGELHSRTTALKELKAGPATFIETKWSAKSKFGANDTIRFSNV
jgi:microcompartment protein CcmK/EutM